ncbi:hypothetical protein [Clavibacter michiganensis]|nr:hypothetical protein [Clavibacter michiganensis subsp. michiganensis]MWJ46227.1 hypothetical protein [Clavibacter michiganensis subsp. michiganensis]
MGKYQPGVDLWPFIKVDLPEGRYEVSSFAYPSCDIGFQMAGSTGPIDSTGHNWMVYPGSPPVRRA